MLNYYTLSWHGPGQYMRTEDIIAKAIKSGRAHAVIYTQSPVSEFNNPDGILHRTPAGDYFYQPIRGASAPYQVNKDGKPRRGYYRWLSAITPTALGSME